MVATLVQEIYDTIPEYFFLVLDDHHTVGEQDQINEFLDHFLTYVDENCHLIIASRTLPALPSLSLLVARRQAAGLSIDELRFTPQEIQDLAETELQRGIEPGTGQQTGGANGRLDYGAVADQCPSLGAVTARSRLSGARSRSTSTTISPGRY